MIFVVNIVLTIVELRFRIFCRRTIHFLFFLQFYQTCQRFLLFSENGDDLLKILLVWKFYPAKQHCPSVRQENMFFCSLSDTFPQTLVRFEENSFFPWIFLRKVVNIWIFQQFLHCRFLILVDHLHLRNGDLPFHDNNQHDRHNHDKHDNSRYIIKIWQ